jgi:hypothetical protein
VAQSSTDARGTDGHTGAPVSCRPSPRNRRRACSLRSQGRLPTREALVAGGMLAAGIDQRCARTGPAISRAHCSTLGYVGDAPPLNEAAMRARRCHPAYVSRIQPRTADPPLDLPDSRSTGSPEIQLVSAFARQPDEILVASADRGGIVRGVLELQLDRPPKLTIELASQASAARSLTDSRAPRWTGQLWGEPPDGPNDASARLPPRRRGLRDRTASPRNPHADAPAARISPGRGAGTRSPCSPERHLGSPLGHHPSTS